MFEPKTFTAKGKIFQDPVGTRTWIEIETEDGLRLSVGFKGEDRHLDRYYLKTEDFTDDMVLVSDEWRDRNKNVR